MLRNHTEVCNSHNEISLYSTTSTDDALNTTLGTNFTIG
jgi:hypothetical protein